MERIYMWNCPSCGYNHVDGYECPYCGHIETEDPIEREFRNLFTIAPKRKKKTWNCKFCFNKTPLNYGEYCTDCGNEDPLFKFHWEEEELESINKNKEISSDLYCSARYLCFTYTDYQDMRIDYDEYIKCYSAVIKENNFNCHPDSIFITLMLFIRELKPKVDYAYAVSRIEGKYIPIIEKFKLEGKHDKANDIEIKIKNLNDRLMELTDCEIELLNSSRNFSMSTDKTGDVDKNDIDEIIKNSAESSVKYIMENYELWIKDKEEFYNRNEKEIKNLKEYKNRFGDQ